MPKIYIECDCHTELIQLEYEPDGDLLYMAYYTYSHSKGFSIRNRLRHIWKIIRDGHPYNDEIILGRAERKKLELALKSFDKTPLLRKKSKKL
jgi:hypothetical protein